MEKRITIKDWSAEERPREKFIAKGAQSMSNAELLAILIGSGNRKFNAVELARSLLQEAGGRLGGLGKFEFEELLSFSGIGRSKALIIMALFELARRYQAEIAPTLAAIYSSENAAKVISPFVKDLAHEECWVMYLNRANRLINKEKVSSGGVHSTVFDVKIILKRAMANLASSIIVVHNHPSGTLRPGAQDIAQTKRLKEAAKMCDISLLDHIIIAGESYYSFADSGTF
ncbi:MAG: DNA repair protein RadC [Bacteroidales bacterium]|nr:DNA repair protein RadC [Bacteroidales bacterium]